MATIMTKHHITNDQARKFQNILIEARLSKGWKTQTEAAKHLGVSQSLLSSLENGPTDGMRMLDFFDIIYQYGITANEIAAILGFGEEKQTEDEETVRVKRRLDNLPPDRKKEVLQVMNIILGQ